MIKVLQIGMTDNLGGIESYLINYYRNIDKNKINFDFINIYPNPLCFQNEIENGKSKIYKITSYYRNPFKFIAELKKIIIENDYQIIHCNMNSAVMIFPLIAAKIAKAKIIIAHAHNSSSDKGMLKKILHFVNKRFIPLFANVFFACSNKAGKWFFNKKILNSNNYFIINNAIEVEKFKFNNEVRKKLRKKLNIPAGAFVVGHVGRFVPQKNHIFLIDIFKKIYTENNNSYLILIGDGYLEEKIKNKIKEFDLLDNVLFFKKRNDINNFYQVMDAFILPSLYEGLPLVGIEAQVSGLNCFFSDRVTDEINITNSVNFISLNDSSSLWSSKIICSLKIKESKDRNDNYFKMAKSNYNIKNAARNLIEIYETIIRKV